jgi:hypothetical protein
MFIRPCKHDEAAHSSGFSFCVVEA